MESVFKEQLVKKEKNPKDSAMKVGIIILAIIVIIFVNILIPSFGVFIALAVGYGTYWFLQRFDIEYEYVFTNGELDIDAIFSKSKRKRMLAIDVKTFDLMAQIEDPMYLHEWKRAQKTLDYSSGKIKPNTYGVLFTQQGELVHLIFEPNDSILDGMARYIPRQLHRKQKK